MPFRPYGGYVWSDQPAPSEPAWKPYGLALGVAAGLGLTAYGVTRTASDGTRSVDALAIAARSWGNRSPFQAGNTFRIPEFLSTLLSPDAQGLTNNQYIWNQRFFKNKDTLNYLKILSGKTEKELVQLGLSLSSGDDLATKLVFRKGPKDIAGTLYAVVGGKEQELVKKVLLEQFTDESKEFGNIIKSKGINQAVHATLQAMGVTERENIEVPRLFYGKPEKVDRKIDRVKVKKKKGFKFKKVSKKTIIRQPPSSPRPSLIPVSIEGYARSPYAFFMQRFNRLVEGLGESILGKSGMETLGTMGIKPTVTPGPGLKMFGRYGVKAAAVGGVWLGLRESDWIRRKFGYPGRLVASAGVSAGVAWGLKKFKFSKKTQFFGALASFAGQAILPGFGEGVGQGIATQAVNLEVFRANSLNPANYYRRTLEGIAPGISSWQTGALLATGVGIASYGRLPWSGKSIAQHIGPEQLGIAARTIAGEAVSQPKNVRDLFWGQMYRGLKRPKIASEIEAKTLDELKEMYETNDGWLNQKFRRKVKAAYKEANVTGTEYRRQTNTAWSLAENELEHLAKTNPVNQALIERLDQVNQRWSGKKDLLSRAGRVIEGAWEQARHSFLGAQISGVEKEVAQRGFKLPVGRLGLLVGGTVLAHQIITGGLLGSMETSQELADIYSGKQQVEIKKSRWWEAGGTPLEGGTTSYYRPSLYTTMMNRVRQKGVWGTDEDRRSPLTKFFLKNFTYTLEREQYYDRPYPLSSGFMSDVPIIGGLLAGSIGRLIKPVKVMHADEFIRESKEGGLEYASVHKGWRREPGYDLGAMGPGIPDSPFSNRSQLSAINYQFRELSGLCFVGDTKVNTSNGRIPIRDVSIGEWVSSLDGKYHQVTGKLTIKEHDKSLLKFKIATTGTEFTCTDNHWIPVLKRERWPCGAAKQFKNYDLKDYQAKDLVPGDFLVVPVNTLSLVPPAVDLGFLINNIVTDNWIYWKRTKIDFAEVYEAVEYLGHEPNKQMRLDWCKIWKKDHISHAISKWKNKFPIRRWKRFFDLNPDTLWFLGRYVAEGNTEIESSRIQFTLNYKEDHIATDLERIGFEQFGCILNKRAGLKDSSIQIKMSHGGLALFLDNEFGKGAHNKHIPTWVKNLPKELLVHFISGLCNGDGWSGGFKSCSRDLVLDTFECLLKLGIRCRCQLDKTQKKGGPYSNIEIPKKHLDRYTLVLSRTVPEIIQEYPGASRSSFLRDNKLFVQIQSVKQVLKSEPVYDLTIEGLHYYVIEEVAVHNTGWVANTVSDMVLGQSIYGTDRPQLAEAGAMTSVRKQFWELELGGGMFLTEAMRRILPAYPSELETQNPIANTMPAWLGEKFAYGDPMRLVSWGEARLPGPGYAAQHPELEGVAAEDYPLVYRYDILGSVSPFSKEFNQVQQALYSMRTRGETTPKIDAFIDRVDEMVFQRYQQYDFQRIHKNAVELPGSGITQALWFGAQRKLRESVAPLEYLVPGGFRPVQKLLGENRSPEERYEFERLYGTNLAFWDKPWRDWLRPAAYSALSLMGYSGKPIWRQEADHLNARFDQLEFTKWMSAADRARMQGDKKSVSKYEFLASQTRMGVNPQGNPLGIYWTLPSEDRTFFNAFAMAKDNQRQRILEMVPEDQVHLYQSIWQRVDRGDESLYSGVPLTPDKQYLRTKYQQIQNQGSQPPSDWVGWHDDVDLQDIKVKYLSEIGRDLHDFGEWESSLKKVRQQPFLEGSTQFLRDSGSLTRSTIQSSLYNTFGSQPKLSVTTSDMHNSSLDLSYDDYRDTDIHNAVQDRLNGRR